MSKIYDLEYTVGGLFTCFVPNTKAGECAWKSIAAQTTNSGKIFSAHLDATLKQLRNAGYSVCKARKAELTLDDIFAEEDELLAELMA